MGLHQDRWGGCAGGRSKRAGRVIPFYADARDARSSGAVVPHEFAGEADQDRRQGGQPRPIRHVPDGRGRGAATGVPRHSAADRPVAGTARASMRGVVMAMGPRNSWRSTP
jgi:hypothetical protein